MEQELLKEILKEVRNLSFLFYGYFAVWAVIFGYVYSLSRRQRETRKEIEALRKALGEEGGGRQA